jgi:hypothetical protein
MVRTVTSHDNATVGSGSVVNEVRSTFDGRGNLTTFEVDPDSTIGTSGVPAKSVSYVYDCGTTGNSRDVSRFLQPLLRWRGVFQ